MGVEAAVGPHRLAVPWPRRRHPPHRLTKANSCGAHGRCLARPLAQPGHHHLAGAGGNGQLPGDSRGRRYSRGGALPPSSVHRSTQMVESRSIVRGELAGSVPQRPRPGPTTAAHAVELTDMPPGRKLRRLGPCRVDGRLDHAACEHRPSHQRAAHRRRRCSSPPASAEATSVSILSPVFAVPALLDRGQGDGRRVPARPRCPARVAGRSRPALATRRWSCKEDADTVGQFWSQHLLGAALFPGWFLFQNHYPRFSRSTRWLLQGLSQRPSFGGLGLAMTSLRRRLRLKSVSTT